MSNRLGLVENEAYEEFVATNQMVASELGRMLFAEVVEPNWMSTRDRAAKAATRAEAFAHVVIRSQIHLMSQPLITLSALVDRLNTLLARKDLSEDVRTIIQNVVQNANAELKLLHSTVRTALNSDTDIRIEPFDVGDAVDLACAAQLDLAEERGVAVFREGSPDELAVGSSSMTVGAIAAVLQNAIQVRRPKGRTPTVTIAYDLDSQYLRVLITDNGVGIKRADVSKIWRRGFSLTGGTGAGLDIAREAMYVSTGDVELVDTGASGSTFVVLVPRPGALRKEGIVE
jgi:signal transduction histidine kinase